MQRVGLESLAGIFFRHTRERPRAHHVDAHRQQQDYDRHRARPNRHGCAADQPLDRLPDDVHRREQQERRFDERRKTFDFSVTVEMLRVGGLVRHAHGKIRNHGGHQIEDRMQRFGENAKAARNRHQKNLQRHEHNRGANRPQRRHALLAAGLFDCGGRHSRDYTLRCRENRRVRICRLWPAQGRAESDLAGVSRKGCGGKTCCR